MGADETAYGDRSAPFLLGIEANWEDAADDDANIAWAREAYRTTERFSTGCQYLDFPRFYEGGELTLRTTFGLNYERLVAIKKEWDPTNFFSLNQNDSHIP